jgi:hypothetical protein
LLLAPEFDVPDSYVTLVEKTKGASLAMHLTPLKEVR